MLETEEATLEWVEQQTREIVAARIAADPTGKALAGYIILAGEDMVRWQERRDGREYVTKRKDGSVVCVHINSYDEARHERALDEYLNLIRQAAGKTFDDPRAAHYLAMGRRMLAALEAPRFLP